MRFLLISNLTTSFLLSQPKT